MARSEGQTLIGIWCCLYTADFINPCFSPGLSLLSFLSHAHNPSSLTLCLALPLHLYLHPSVVSCLSLWLSLNLIPFQLHIGPGSLALASLHCWRVAPWPCWMLSVCLLTDGPCDFSERGEIFHHRLSQCGSELGARRLIQHKSRGIYNLLFCPWD